MSIEVSSIPIHLIFASKYSPIFYLVFLSHEGAESVLEELEDPVAGRARNDSFYSKTSRSLRFGIFHFFGSLHSRLSALSLELFR